MKKYSFLLKPIFFIFSLLFATWMVVEIEKISPSDFGDVESRDVRKPIDPKDNYHVQGKKYLKNICTLYKLGAIDSIQLDKKLSIFLRSSKSAAN